MPWTVMVGMLMLRFGAVAFARLYFSWCQYKFSHLFLMSRCVIFGRARDCV
jgi:hypothetical protein